MSTAGTIIPIVSANANPDLCTSCGGQCCSHFPGALIPADIDPELDPTTLFVKMDDLLKTGRWTLDQREDMLNGRWFRFYIVRPAIKGYEGDRVHKGQAFSGDCTFKSTTGCELSEANRPSECKSLIPHEKGLGHCIHGPNWSSSTIDKAWIPFSDLTDELL